MGASRRDLETALDMLLTTDLRKVRAVAVVAGLNMAMFIGHRRDRRFASEVIDEIREGAYGEDLDSFDQRCLPRVVVRHERTYETLVGRD